MAKNLWLERFDPTKKFVARRAFGDFKAGDIVVKDKFTVRRLRQLYDARVIVHADVWKHYISGEPVKPAPVLAALPGVIATPAPVTVPAPDSDGQSSKNELIKDAEDLGIKVDGRWSAERLKAEIDKALDNGESA